MKQMIFGLLTMVATGALWPGVAAAQEPKKGGTFVFSSEQDPSSLDCHMGTDVFAMQHLAPEYSTLLRYNPAKFPEIEGDLAESWTVSDDNLTYTFKIRPGVTFHNGYPLTAADVKATFERIMNPPEGVTSPRKAELADIGSVEAPDDTTLVITLKDVNPTMLTSLANPWNCVYSARLLAENPDYPSRVVMGSGPFKFEEFVPGSHWKASRFENYFRDGLPHIDGFELKRMDTRAMVNAFSAGQLQGWFRQLTPPQRTQIEAARGDKVAFQSTPAIGMNLVAFNTKRNPFDDVRVRRALALAIDHHEGAKVLGRTSFSKLVGGLLRPGYAMAMTPEELEAMPGFGKDSEAARAEARKLLEEAGVANLNVKLLNRNLPVPNIAFGVFLTDQWQRIGVTTEVTNEQDTTYFSRLRGGDFDVAIDFNVPVSDDPTVALVKYVPGAPTNYARYEDPKVTEFYNRQKRMLDQGQRQKTVRQMEQHVLNEAYYIPLHWAERTIPLAVEVKGFTVTPNNQVGQSLETLWLDVE